MRKLLLISFLFSLAFTGNAQQSSNIVGLLISDDSALPIQLATILNKNKARRSLSSRKGIFRISAEPEDSLLFTSIGYDTMRLQARQLMDLKKDTVILMLHSISYNLKEATIVSTNRKRDSIAREVAKIFKNDTLLNNNDRIIKRPRGSIQPALTPLGGGVVISGPLTELYYKFSKEGKDMVKFEEFVKYYREWQAAESRYNKETIKAMTGLPEESIEDYIKFCKLERKFIIEAEDYDFVKAVKDCERKYRKAHPELGTEDK